MSEVKLDLEAQLIERAIAERNEVLQRARDRAKTIIHRAEEEAERIQKDSERQILNIVGSELRAVRDRIVGQAELEGRKELMNARIRLLDSVFQEARNILEDIAKGTSDEDYHKILKKLISEAVTSIGEKKVIVTANKGDLVYLKENLEEIKREMPGIELTIEGNPLDIMGGVEVKNFEGTKIFRNALEGRLNKVRQEMEAEIAKKLGVI
jgi:vacuolar-type H+-ATPase subunit E/Vma4